MKSFFQGVLVVISLLLLAVLCLPIFFYFLWLSDTTKSIADLLFLPNILIGIVILFIALSFGRIVLVLLKSVKA
jgi:putative effector of murein hydrolase LrgA (UPF0299 family)